MAAEKMIEVAYSGDGTWIAQVGHDLNGFYECDCLEHLVAAIAADQPCVPLVFAINRATLDGKKGAEREMQSCAKAGAFTLIRHRWRKHGAP